MSMSMQLRTVSDEDTQAVAADPLKLEILHYGELSDPGVADDLEEDERNALLAWKPSHEPQVHYLEAAFQSLHFLLTGETEPGKGDYPLNFITARRRPIGEIGWGPSSFYTATEVKTIATALNGLDLQQVRKRYNTDLFNNLFPGGYTWTDQDGEDLLEQLIALRSFIDSTASTGKGIYIVIV